MVLNALFDILWPRYRSDIAFDDSLNENADVLAAPLRVEDVEELLLYALDKHCAETGASGTALAALMLQKAMNTSETRAVVMEAVERLRDPEVLEDLALDCPKAPQVLSDMAASLQLKDKTPRRLRILAIRNGFGPACPAAKALRQTCDLRVPGSPYVAETGNEDAGGRGEQETLAILRQHLQTHSVDLVVAQSRGCRLLVQHIIGGETPCWSGPVLALSPAGEWGLALAAGSHRGSLLIAASGDDLVELGGSHAVLQRGDIESMASAISAHGALREFLYEEDRRGGWADSIVKLVQHAASMC